MYCTAPLATYYTEEAKMRQNDTRDPEKNEYSNVFNFNITVREKEDKHLSLEDADCIWDKLYTTIGHLKVKMNQPLTELDWGKFDNAFMMNDEFLEMHAPVGSLNRVRWLVYEELLSFRKNRF